MFVDILQHQSILCAFHGYWFCLDFYSFWTDQKAWYF